jgi:hypothetical protein
VAADRGEEATNLQHLASLRTIGLDMEKSPSSPPPRGWYQFSLREILLATVAISAVLTIVVKHRPFAPTDFFDELNEGHVLNVVAKRLNLGLATPASSGSISRGGPRAHRSFEHTIGTPDYSTVCQQLMPPLHDDIEKLILDSGCKIDGRSTTGVRTTNWRQGDPLYKELTEFSFDYWSGNVRGKIKVWALERPDGNTRLRIETDEW